MTSLMAWRVFLYDMVERITSSLLPYALRNIRKNKSVRKWELTEYDSQFWFNLWHREKERRVKWGGRKWFPFIKFALLHFLWLEGRKEVPLYIFDVQKNCPSKDLKNTLKDFYLQLLVYPSVIPQCNFFIN